MAHVCLICNSTKRKQIDAAVVDAKASRRAIAGQYGVSKSSLDRHVTKCIPAKVTAALKEEGITLASRTKEMARRVGEVFAKLDEAKEGEPCPTCGATAFTPAQALETGFLEMKLKAAVTLGKVAELEFGSKGGKPAPADPRSEWSALSPAERRTRLAEMKHRLLELEAETASTEGAH